MLETALSAGLQLQTSINALLTALVNKASTPTIDAMILAHEARLAHITAFNEFVAEKLFGWKPPAPPAAPPVAQ
jgi:hypothetical protein